MTCYTGSHPNRHARGLHRPLLLLLFCCCRHGRCCLILLASVLVTSHDMFAQHQPAGRVAESNIVFSDDRTFPRTFQKPIDFCHHLLVAQPHDTVPRHTNPPDSPDGGTIDDDSHTFRLASHWHLPREIDDYSFGLEQRFVCLKHGTYLDSLPYPLAA